MKVKELIAALEKLDPDLAVLQGDLNDSGLVWSIESVRVVVAQEGQFPEDYKMPAGYQFVKLS